MKPDTKTVLGIAITLLWIASMYYQARVNAKILKKIKEVESGEKK